MPSHHGKTTSVAIAGAFVALACGGEIVNANCPDIARPAVAVTVEDSVSGAPIAAGATLVIVDGTFADSITIPPEMVGVNSWALVTPESYERAGTYDVTVRRSGYQDWHRNDVRVRTDVCGVVTRSFRARMQPAP